MEIREALKMLQPATPKTVIAGKVTAVNGNRISVQPMDDDAPEYADISLATGNVGAIKLIPDIGSEALVVLDSPTTGTLIAADKCRIELNGGENGATVLLEPLVDKLNAIERDINNLRRQMGTWVATPQDGGAALKVAVSAWLTSSIVETKKPDLSNPNITQ